MKILDKEDYGFVLYEDDHGTFLNVICGGAGIFNLVLKLDPEEKKLCLSSKEYVRSFANKVSKNPNLFIERQYVGAN